MVAAAALIAAALAVVCSSAQGGARQAASHGPEERGFSSVAVDPRDERTVYAAGGRGIFKSADGGQTWRAVDKGLVSRYVFDLAIDQHDPATLYAATAGGVFKSTDAATSWRLTGLPVGAIAVLIDPLNSNTLYVAADVRGVFKSSNGGQTWRELIEDPLERFYALALNPKHRTTVYAGAGSGVFKTLDGEHFDASGLSRGLFRNETGFEAKHRLWEGFVTALAINPRVPSTLYLGCDYGVFKTANSGFSWRRTSNGIIGANKRYKPVGSLRLDPSKPNTLYAGLYPGGVFKTTDGGRHWRLLGLRDKGYVLALGIAPQNPKTIYAGTSGGYPVEEGALYKSIDGGRSWRTLLMPRS
jgi:photosystem II stability/assembly factor-like uncharacterized protein